MLGAKWRGGQHGRTTAHGPQVREQPERLSDSEQSLLGTHLRARHIPLRSAHRAEQHGVRSLAERDRLVGQRIACFVDRDAADQSRLELEVMSEPLGHRVEHGASCRDDLGPDAIARKQCDHRCAPSNTEISLIAPSRKSISPIPSSRQCFANGAMGNFTTSPSGS